MSQTISVSTTMGEQGFRDFAVFDAFHHRKAWLRPAVFAAIMLAFAAVCLSQLGKRPGAGLLAAVLAIVGILSIFIPFADGICRKDPWNWEYDCAESNVAAKKALLEKEAAEAQQ